MSENIDRTQKRVKVYYELIRFAKKSKYNKEQIEVFFFYVAR